jgi:hypothetical protein
MASISIKDFPDNLLVRLKILAARERVTLRKAIARILAHRSGFNKLQTGKTRKKSCVVT